MNEEDREIYSPGMSLVEYWYWSREHDPKWRRNMTAAIILVWVAAITLPLLLIACSNPQRFEPQRRQQLQHQQDECLAKGGNPQQCRP